MLSALGVICAAAITPADEPGIEYGRITYIEGAARKHFVGSEGWVSIDTLTTLDRVDSIMTLGVSRLEFELPGNGVFRLGPFSTAGIIRGDFSVPEFVSGSMWADFDSLSDGDYPRCYLPYLKVYSKNANCRFICGADCSTEIRVYGGSLKLYWRQVPNSEDTSTALRHYPCGLDSLHTIWNVRLVIEENRKVILSSKGDIVFQGYFSPSDPDEDIDWVSWNLKRDEQR